MIVGRAYRPMDGLGIEEGPPDANARQNLATSMSMCPGMKDVRVRSRGLPIVPQSRHASEELNATHQTGPKIDAAVTGSRGIPRRGAKVLFAHIVEVDQNIERWSQKDGDTVQ